MCTFFRNFLFFRQTNAQTVHNENERKNNAIFLVEKKSPWMMLRWWQGAWWGLVLGTSAHHASCHRLTAILGLFFSFPTEKVNIKFSFYMCCLCVCLPKEDEIPEKKLHIVFWCLIRKDICLQPLVCFDLLSECWRSILFKIFINVKWCLTWTVRHWPVIDELWFTLIWPLRLTGCWLSSNYLTFSIKYLLRWF